MNFILYSTIPVVAGNILGRVRNPTGQPFVRAGILLQTSDQCRSCLREARHQASHS